MITDKIKPIPNTSVNKKKATSGTKNQKIEKGTLLIKEIMNSGISETIKFIPQDSILERGKIYLGKYTLVINEEFANILFKHWLVVSEK